MLEITFVSQVSVEKKQILWFIFKQKNRKKYKLTIKVVNWNPQIRFLHMRKYNKKDITCGSLQLFLFQQDFDIFIFENTIIIKPTLVNKIKN